MPRERAWSRDYADFRDFLEASCARGGTRVAFRWRPEGAEAERLLRYDQLREGADALGRHLLGAGLRSGAAVAILSENRPEWCLSYLGVAAAGLVAVPLDASLDEGGLLRNLVAARCEALLASGRLLGRMPRLAAAPGLRLVADFDLPETGAPAGPSSGASPAARPFAALLAGAEEPRLPRPGEIGGDSRAVVFFTSGTTGVAKGISLSHRAVIANVDASREALHVDERDVFIAMLPLHHTYATTCSFLSSVEAGCACVVVDRVAPSAILRAIREGGVSFLIGVPILFDKVRSGIESEIAKLAPAPRAAVRGLLALSRFAALRLGLPFGRLIFGGIRRKAGLATVRLAVSGGGPLAPATADFFDALGIELVQGYGMSENGPLISVNLPGNKDNRSVGLPVKRTELRIDGAGEDGIGEIQVRSPSLMQGYLDAPEATRDAFTADGWLRTGDLGRIEGRGFVFITGRRKSLIVTEGGKNVYPEEIEGRFEGSDWVKEALVVGRPARPGRSGEEVWAVLVPDLDKVSAAHPGRAADEALLRALLKEDFVRVDKGLPPYMKMVDFIVRREEFEKTSTRKIKRFLYREYSSRP